MPVRIGPGRASVAFVVIVMTLLGCGLTRISHQLFAAAGDASHPAVLSPLGVLNVLLSTPPRPSSRKPHSARHLAALATKPGEICGLSAASDPLEDLPASFEGELPCADCPGIFHHLDLFEDKMYFLRTTYLGRGAGAVNDSIGSWAVAAENGRLALFGGTEAPVYFRVVDRDTLRKLDVEGRAIQSSLNYDLKRLDEADPVEPRLMMRGMYRYMADAAIFVECLSGRRFHIAQEADNLSLERAYLEARRQPGEELLVSLQGRIAERPAMEGDALVLTVVPERFIGVWPGETCLGSSWK